MSHLPGCERMLVLSRFPACECRISSRFRRDALWRRSAIGHLISVAGRATAELPLQPASSAYLSPRRIAFGQSGR